MGQGLMHIILFWSNKCIFNCLAFINNILKLLKIHNTLILFLNNINVFSKTRHELFNSLKESVAQERRGTGAEKKRLRSLV